MADIKIRRVYEDPAGETGDGFRVFVDRLWPRGESKAKFHYDLWEKSLAPSTELREWFHADPDSRWEEFCKRYEAELDSNPAVSGLISEISDKPVVTLLYGSRDVRHNNAEVLAEYLRRHLR